MDVRARSGRRVPHGLGRWASRANGPSMSSGSTPFCIARHPGHQRRLRRLSGGHAGLPAPFLGPFPTSPIPSSRWSGLSWDEAARFADVVRRALAHRGGVGVRRPRGRRGTRAIRGVTRARPSASTRPPRVGTTPANPHRPHRPFGRLPRVVCRLVRRARPTRAGNCRNPRGPVTGASARQPRWGLAPRRPVEPGRPSLVAASGAPLLRLRRTHRPRPLAAHEARRIESRRAVTRQADGSRTTLGAAGRHRHRPHRSHGGRRVVSRLRLARGKPLFTPALLGNALFSRREQSRSGSKSPWDPSSATPSSTAWPSSPSA